MFTQVPRNQGRHQKWLSSAGDRCTMVIPRQVLLYLCMADTHCLGNFPRTFCLYQHF
uniref:Uncharacterized protein n=1 Tax=Anguilla anguilla TaxID=7936 RepID=A0A0E9P7M3_ANGAN